MSCRYCSLAWPLRGPTREEVAWYRRGVMILALDRIGPFPSRLFQTYLGYQLHSWLESFQRRLDVFRNDTSQSLGILFPAMSMVIRRDIPNTLFIVTESELRDFYLKWEGAPPIVTCTWSQS